jgi:hypothetical protein
MKDIMEAKSPPLLSPFLFWDTQQQNIDFDKHARQIIERVVTRGTIEDWLKIKAYYGLERIKEEVVKIRSLDRLTLHFLSTIFQIPKTQFKCYNTEPSIQRLWHY